jgi:hypothetical protein
MLEQDVQPRVESAHGLFVLRVAPPQATNGRTTSPASPEAGFKLSSPVANETADG